MKALFKSILAASVLASVASHSQAQLFPMTIPMALPQFACATPLGVFPMNGGFPGQPCGNGVNHGMTIVLPPAPSPAWPGTPGMTPVGAPPLGVHGQVAGALGANREMQLAAECSTAGNPKAIGVCIVGRLTSEEFAKCQNGIGTAGGCFAPGNTLRVHVENGIKDLFEGPGESNDLCTIFDLCF